jgi:hypothetical protein
VRAQRSMAFNWLDVVRPGNGTPTFGSGDGASVSPAFSGRCGKNKARRRRWRIAVSDPRRYADAPTIGVGSVAALETATMHRRGSWVRTTRPEESRRRLSNLQMLDTNPLESISHTRRIAAVAADGRYYDRAALDGLLADAQTATRMFKPRR